MGHRSGAPGTVDPEGHILDHSISTLLFFLPYLCPGVPRYARVPRVSCSAMIGIVAWPAVDNEAVEAIGTRHDLISNG